MSTYREEMLYAAVKACNRYGSDRVEWFHDWAHQEPPTDAEMALTTFLLEYAQVLADNNGLVYHDIPECYGHVHRYEFPGFCESNRHLNHDE